ncbi:DUF86 domain-containing protein [Candidatus Kaiserbacteria bacterium]|nr:DUF86 domain-containing protein [Candidatus Kaiserbacteria bacterium]
MTDLAQELIAEKITKCAGALADLKRYREVGTLEYLRATPDIYFAVCYRFLTAIESLFDLGQFTLADVGVRAESQREVPVLLAKHTIITDDLADRFVRMYGFRNRLAHGYDSLSDEKVAEYLAKHLDDIESLLTVFQKGM